MATTKNVRWAAKLGSQAYGNTTVANGKVYVGTNNETPRDKRHIGDRGQTCRMGWRGDAGALRRDARTV